MYENGMNGILADEMGLGKTLQSVRSPFFNFRFHFWVTSNILEKTQNQILSLFRRVSLRTG
jgi:hypothetical protein